MSNQKPSFRFEIDNCSTKEYTNLSSETFVSGGCEWYLTACVYPKEDQWDTNYLSWYNYYYPKGYRREEHHLSLFLEVANPRPLQTGWTTSAEFYFVVSNPSGKELFKTFRTNNLFSAEDNWWGFENIFPISRLKENLWVPGMDKLIIDVYITNVEALVEKNEIVEINGFQVLASQATPVLKLFAKHPDIAEDFKLKNQMVKTEYMKVLLSLIETLDTPLKNLSETELSNARIELCELIEVGFKLDWLRSKFEEVPLETKKTDDADGSQVQQHEERIKNLELMVSNLKVELDKKKTKYCADGFLLVEDVA